MSCVYDAFRQWHQTKSLYWVIGAIITVGGIITLIACLSKGAVRVDYNQVAFQENTLTGALHGPYGQGIHVFTPNSEMHYFENTVLSMTPSLSCFSYDKLSLTVLVAVQFSYDQSKLEDVLKRFGTEDNYRTTLDQNVTNIVTTTCAKFNATGNCFPCLLSPFF